VFESDLVVVENQFESALTPFLYRMGHLSILMSTATVVAGAHIVAIIMQKADWKTASPDARSRAVALLCAVQRPPLQVSADVVAAMTAGSLFDICFCAVCWLLPLAVMLTVFTIRSSRHRRCPSAVFHLTRIGTARPPRTRYIAAATTAVCRYGGRSRAAATRDGV